TKLSSASWRNRASTTAGQARESRNCRSIGGSLTTVSASRMRVTSSSCTGSSHTRSSSSMGCRIAEEDPIGHFTARANAVEGHLANQNFWNHVQTSEAQIRKELGEEHYDAACQHLEDLRRQELAQAHPDHSPQMQAAAHRFGMSPAQLREHMLNQDRIAVAR